jgi:hypothetical protein
MSAVLPATSASSGMPTLGQTVPASTSGSVVPSVGGSATSPRPRYGTAVPDGFATTERAVTCVLSNDATPMTFSPRPGAPAEYRPEAPELPIEATTTMPRSTSRLLAVAVG